MGRWCRLVGVISIAAALACGSPASLRPRGTPVGAGPIAPLPDDRDLRDRELPPAPPPPPMARLDSAHEIRDAVTWQRLAARPASSSVARTEVVKFLVDLHDGGRIWFVDTETYDIHFFFARDRLGVPGHEHEAFNRREYRRDDRRFELGSVVHYLDSDLWALELISGDTLGGERIVALRERIAAALWTGDQLRFRPTSILHEQSIAGVRDRLPTVTTAEVFAGVRYQPLTQGIAFGTLRIVRGTLDPATVRPDQILVLEQLPDEIPVVAGVISAELQAPLGHIAILCANRATPNMGLRGALDHAELARLDGRLVQLTVGTQEFGVRPATIAEAEASWAARRPAQTQVPRLDRRETRLVPVCDLRLADARYAGAKAAQLGEVCGLGARTPGGFSIPVAHYLEHLDARGIAIGLPQMLQDPTFRTDAQVRASRLAQVRTMIESAPVDPQLVRAVRREILRTNRSARWILRSSTNAEDLSGFTGAGLYRSIVIPAGATEARIETALREVWASVWLQGAYEEREWYRVDHAAVAMAILAQPFVDGATANGVAITANPFYQARPGYYVNAQALGGSVTGAAGEEMPEQHLIYTYTDTPEYELLSRSTRNDGAPLLGEPQLLDLYGAFVMLHRHFVGGEGYPRRWPEPVNAVDVEFLVANGQVVIVQARPYHVVYGPGQTW